MSTLVVVIALLAGPANAAALVAKPSEFQLPNGLRIVVVPDHRAPIVTHMVFYKIGAADETPAELGLAHFLEHTMFLGTAKFPQGEFDRFIITGGGAHNATTTQDATTYYQRMPRNALEHLMELEADRMQNLQFAEDAARNERNVVMEEYLGKAGQPAFAFFAATASLLFADHPYARHPIGNAEAISQFDGAKAMAFYRRHYTPQHAIVVIGGDVTEAEVRQMAARTYGRVARRDDVASTQLPALALPVASQRVVVPHPLASTVEIGRTYLTQGASAMSMRDATALNLFTFIVSDGMLSRLHRALVANGLASAVSGGYALRRAAGEVTFTVTALPGVPVDAIEPVFDRVLADVALHGITQSEFDDMKQRFLATQVYDDDNFTTRASTIGNSLIVGWSLNDVLSFNERLEGLSVDDVNDVARRILTQSRNVTGVLVPQPVRSASTTLAP